MERAGVGEAPGVHREGAVRKDPLEEFWGHILLRAQREIAAILADTIDVKPSGDPETWDLVQRLIDLEQELSR